MTSAASPDSSPSASPSTSSESTRSWRDSLEVYFNRRQLIVLLLGFASGLPLLLTLSTLSAWLHEAGVSKTSIGLFALVGLPYTFKFLWAPILDRVPLPLLTRWLGQRRGWLVVIEVGLIAAIIALGSFDPQTELAGMAIAALCVTFLSASQDVVIDAYRIEILSEREQGAGAAVTQWGYRFGLIAAGAGALFLADAIVSWFWVYAAMAALLGVGLATILLSPEPEREEPEPLVTGETGKRHLVLAWLANTVAAPFADFMKKPGWALILLFILIYKFGDAFAGVMAYPFYFEMGFSKSEVAAVSKIYGVGATLIGVWLGGTVVYRYGVMKALLICGLFQMFSNLMYAVQALVGYDIRMLMVMIGIENASAGMGSAAFVAYMSVLCSTSFTGTQYALLSSLMAVGRTALSATSGWFADHFSWVAFFVLSTVVAAPGLLLLVWMMRRYPHLEPQRRESSSPSRESPPRESTSRER